MSKKVLLTGGCGFIGHHAVEHFLERTDWELVVLDGLTYAGDAGRVTGIRGYSPDRVRIFWHDLRAPIMDTLADRIGPVDYIVNIASESHVDRSIDSPVPFIQNNVMLVLHMLEYARKARPEKFLQVSTDEVFGPAPLDYFFKEWDRHIPSNPYAASKSAQESIAISYWRTYGVPLITTSTMNNFGERQHKEKFFPKTMWHTVARKPMPVHAGYTEDGWVPGSRVWLHAKNHADALLYILEAVQPVFYPEADRPSKYNVAGDREMNNLEVVLKISEIMGLPPCYEFVDYHKMRPGHGRRYALDGTKLRERGWVPPLDLDESFVRTVEWYWENTDWLC